MSPSLHALTQPGIIWICISWLERLWVSTPGNKNRYMYFIKCNKTGSLCNFISPYLLYWRWCWKLKEMILKWFTDSENAIVLMLINPNNLKYIVFYLCVYLFMEHFSVWFWMGLLSCRPSLQCHANKSFAWKTKSAFQCWNNQGHLSNFSVLYLYKRHPRENCI